MLDAASLFHLLPSAGPLLIGVPRFAADPVRPWRFHRPILEPFLRHSFPLRRAGRNHADHHGCCEEDKYGDAVLRHPELVLELPKSAISVKLAESSLPHSMNAAARQSFVD